MAMVSVFFLACWDVYACNLCMIFKRREVLDVDLWAATDNPNHEGLFTEKKAREIVLLPLVFNEFRAGLGCLLLRNYSVITESNVFFSLNVTLRNLNSAMT